MRTLALLAGVALALHVQAQPVSTPPPTVRPLVAAQWGQRSPFNLLCPAKDKDGMRVHDLAGCGALAMAQVMHFHRFPDTSPDGKTLYDWERMFNRLTAQTTPDRITNVAKLISDCGVTAFTQYGEAGSSSNTSQVLAAMKRFFHYSRYMYAVSRDAMKARGCDDEFRRLLLEELQAGRPVIYRGTKSPQNNDADGHIFVIDGYKNGKVHANMGWADAANDYYDLDDLNGYAYHQWMIVGIADSSYRPPIKEIRLERPGTLHTRLDSADVHLRISGPLNEADFAALRQLAQEKWRLRSLDLSGATVTGGLPERAFFRCGSLVYVALPPALTYIGRGAFYECTGLNRIDLPDSLAVVGDYAFRGCRFLTTFRLPETLRRLGSRSFQACNSLLSLTLPEGVEYINWQAFADAANLKFLCLPRSLQRVGPEITKGCDKLMCVTLPEDHPSLESDGLRILPKGADVDADGVRHIRLEHAGTLDKYLSTSDWKIRVTGPLNDDDIAALRALAHQENELRDIDLRETDIKVLPRSAFANCKGIWNVWLPARLERIEDFAFSQCSWLEQVHMPATLGAIRTYAFSGCVKLRELRLPASLRIIGEGAFTGCNALTDVSLPEGLETVEGQAFRKCEGLRTLHFPRSLKKAGGGITLDCKNLQSVTLEAGNTRFRVGPNGLEPTAPR